jgi:ATP-dependent DNA helicase RecQ
MHDEAIKCLKQMFGGQASFREGQREAIELALQNKKALIVQQTGWGKSIVYFIATKILRSRGKGPTILITQTYIEEYFNIKKELQIEIFSPICSSF